MTATMNTFNALACEALRATYDGEDFTTENGCDFDSDYSHIQIIPIRELGDWMRSLAVNYSNPEPSYDEIQDAKEGAWTIMIDHEIYAMVDNGTGELKMR